MTETVPIFPLEIVVYPGESLNLHIFEPRYKQLINECAESGMQFGIPCVVDKKLAGLGTMIELVEIARRYEDGTMDIKTRGAAVFQLRQVIKLMPDKLYSGAVIQRLDNNERSGNPELMRQVLAKMKLLFKLLGTSKSFSKPEPEMTSYDMAHHVGLSLEKEYDLLGILDEHQRQEYLNRHLTEMLPMLSEIESLKKKIQFNGHYRPLPGADA
jgi:Lon protease-like protein